MGEGAGKTEREEVESGKEKEGGDLTFMFLLSKNSRTSSSVHSNERFPR